MEAARLSLAVLFGQKIDIREMNLQAAAEYMRNPEGLAMFMTLVAEYRDADHNSLVQTVLLDLEKGQKEVADMVVGMIDNDDDRPNDGARNALLRGFWEVSTKSNASRIFYTAIEEWMAKGNLEFQPNTWGEKLYRYWVDYPERRRVEYGWPEKKAVPEW